MHPTRLGLQRRGTLGTESATVTVSGSGGAQVDVTEFLDATVDGSGSITYRGDPRVAQDVDCSGSVPAA